jgi:hypothetical protein
MNEPCFNSLSDYHYSVPLEGFFALLVLAFMIGFVAGLKTRREP